MLPCPFPLHDTLCTKRYDSQIYCITKLLLISARHLNYFSKHTSMNGSSFLSPSILMTARYLPLGERANKDPLETSKGKGEAQITLPSSVTAFDTTKLRFLAWTTSVCEVLIRTVLGVGVVDEDGDEDTDGMRNALSSEGMRERVL